MRESGFFHNHPFQRYPDFYNARILNGVARRGWLLASVFVWIAVIQIRANSPIPMEFPYREVILPAIAVVGTMAFPQSVGVIQATSFGDLGSNNVRCSHCDALIAINSTVGDRCEQCGRQFHFRVEYSRFGHASYDTERESGKRVALVLFLFGAFVLSRPAIKFGMARLAAVTEDEQEFGKSHLEFGSDQGEEPGPTTAPRQETLIKEEVVEPKSPIPVESEPLAPSKTRKATGGGPHYCPSCGTVVFPGQMTCPTCLRDPLKRKTLSCRECGSGLTGGRLSCVACGFHNAVTDHRQVGHVSVYGIGERQAAEKIDCPSCGRVVRASAPRCMWCGTNFV
jgi:uncharacterized OB-fold protein